MTQLTISVANEAKYKALLAFIAQEGDIIIENKPQKAKKTTFSATVKSEVAAAPKNKSKTMPKMDLSQFCGILKPAQTIDQIDAQLAELRQEWERNF
jgi:hypothetical protein